MVVLVQTHLLHIDLKINNYSVLTDISFGIMQGRLLPKYLGRYQAHPLNYWQDEFPIAASLGIKFIEFILDFTDYDLNPLMTKKGLVEIRNCSEVNGVGISSICADYFMEAPLHSPDTKVVESGVSILMRLLDAGSVLGIKDIVIPCVDHSSLKNDEAIKRFIDVISSLGEVAEKYGINLAIESDLNPVKFVQLLDKLPVRSVTVNYDSGNSASLGYNIKEEFTSYGKRISDLHIKDRIYQGGSVQLGYGNVDWNIFFSELDKLNYKGPLIMQAYRDDEGVEVFKTQLDWIKNRIKEYNGSLLRQ
jgi:L-ribulose-5-phosphate 3-epimerase